MTSVDVFAGSSGSLGYVGQAHFTRNRGSVSTTFIYAPGYLAAGGTSIDPALPLVSGAQYQGGLFGAFTDSAPDRWGRNLIEKAERIRARNEGVSPRQLDDLDFLLGVSDDTRQGALRFRFPEHEEFLGEPSRVPPLVSLPELLRASDELDSGGDSSIAVKQLLDTGTTGLGGARPKASVRLEGGDLAIAKFPDAGDKWDVMAWESTALDLLESCGICTPRRRLVQVGNRNVLVLRRFDRTNEGQRIGYISAMTATGSMDGQSRDYVEIVEAMRDLSPSLERDHHEIFARVVASVALGNTDDHLRNHGFLVERGAWKLSPAFDVNPNPDVTRRRSTSIMGADTFPEEASALLDFAEECNLRLAAAREIIGNITGALSQWKQQARKNQIREGEISLMAESISLRLEAVIKACQSWM